MTWNRFTGQNSSSSNVNAAYQTLVNKFSEVSMEELQRQTNEGIRINNELARISFTQEMRALYLTLTTTDFTGAKGDKGDKGDQGDAAVSYAAGITFNNTVYENLLSDNVQAAIDEITNSMVWAQEGAGLFSDYQAGLLFDLYQNNSGTNTGDQDLSHLSTATNMFNGTGVQNVNQDSCNATGDNAAAFGRLASASGKSSFAEGDETWAVGDYSHAAGISNRTAYLEYIIGRYASIDVDDVESATTYDPNGFAFKIGNGTDADNRSNAFAVKNDGTVLLSGEIRVSSGPDLETEANDVVGAINELVTSIGNKIAKTTNITAFSETGIADTGIPMYDVPNKTIKPSGKVLGDLALKGGTVVSDTTYNATYIAGTWTADESTDVLTCSGLHGLVVNRVVSFNALTGVLPTGISAEPEFYFVTSVPTTSTLTISLTRGGATLNITANGTTGWGIRRMDVIPSNTPLDFATYSEFDIYSDMGLCGSTTTANAYPLLSIIPNTTRITMNSASIYGATSEATMTGALSSKKYVKAPIFINIRKMATNLYFITCNVTGLYSDNIDMTSSTAMTSYLSGTITTADVTAILFASGYSTAVKNGTRVVVIGR